jgi:hypothetical protein
MVVPRDAGTGADVEAVPDDQLAVCLAAG